VLVNLTIKEAQELVTVMEEDHGIVASNPIIASDLLTPTTDGTEAAEQTSFDVVLKSYPTELKLKLVRVVKEATGLGLREAKEVVDRAPSTIVEGVDKITAQALKKSFEEYGTDVVVEMV